MKALHGKQAINYLLSLKEYEKKQAMKKPIGQRVKYYRIQTDWIMEMLKEEYNNSLLNPVYTFKDYINFQKGEKSHV